MKPQLVTTRREIRTVVERWRRQYPEGQCHARMEETYERLLRLDLETCSAEDVNAAIGNNSWTHIDCDGCGQDVGAAVTVGQEPDYESSTATLCKSCLLAALKLMETP